VVFYKGNNLSFIAYVFKTDDVSYLLAAHQVLLVSFLFQIVSAYYLVIACFRLIHCILDEYSLTVALRHC